MTARTTDISDKTDYFEVEVAFAVPEKQVIKAIQVSEGTTIEQAIEQSNIAQDFPSFDMSSLNVGVFGKAKPRDFCLREFDRVEIYRPLIVDPKEVRKQRAAEAKAKKEKEKKQAELEKMEKRKLASSQNANSDASSSHDEPNQS